MLIPAGHALIGRSDLPLPEWLLVWGVAVILVVSFLGLMLLWERPLLDSEHRRAVSARLSAVLLNPLTRGLAGAVGVVLLGVTIWSGLEGTSAPDRNFSVTFVFVTVWLGFVVVNVLAGDVFRAFNPWRAIAVAASRGFGAIAGRRAPAPLDYPERLGRWPAAIGLTAFLWLELVWGQSGFGSAGLEPRTVAIATLAYSALTFAGMALYGIERWLDRGEFLSVYFGMFARLAPVTVDGGRICLRRPFSGARDWAKAPGSIAVVVVAIGGTSFDGAQEGLLAEAITSAFEALNEAGLGLDLALRLTNTLFLAAMIALVAAVFWAGMAGMQLPDRRGGGRVPGPRRLGGLGRAFAHSFIPIAFAYLVAHYFSLVLFQEQAQFTYLLSDPLGEGSDLFGTAGGGIDYGVVSSDTISWVQFGSIALGHIAALAVGHDKALVVWSDRRQAVISQLFMLAAMVSFSSFGLVLLTFANA